MGGATWSFPPSLTPRPAMVAFLRPRNYGAVMGDSTGYRVPEVCKLVGISYRQLDYWARTDLVTPSVRDAGGSGTQRLYSFQDLVMLRVIEKLLNAGPSVRPVRKADYYLQPHLTADPT